MKKGKKRKTVRAKPSSTLALGVDLGGTHVRAGLVDAKGKIIRIVTSSSQAHEGRSRVLAAIEDVINQVFDKRVTGIGVGVPGHVKDGKIIKLPNLPDIDGVDLKAFLQKKFKKPVAITNDAKCFALAEARFGHGKGKHCVGGVILGTGCGCGIVLDGKIYFGRDNLAGEFGMIHYRATMIEDYVAGRFIKNRAEEFKLQDTAPEAVARDAAGKHIPTHAEEVRLESHDLAKLGDAQKRAKKIFDELGYHLGYLLSIIICAYNPDVIILGGGVSKAHDHFWQSMKQSLDLNLEYQATANTKIAVSTLDEPGVLGAASLML
ncbi:ROK family protein [Candidatus Woesearchaeota archaeon]|nr:ROK family protein [Candidatus Woesearchaeota archaeon]